MAPWNRRAARRQAREATSAPRIASAQVIASAPNLLLRGTAMRQEWQPRARLYARHIGAVRFSLGLIAGTIARCPMTAERLTDPANDQWTPQDDPIANSALRLYRNSQDSGAELVRRHAWHKLVSGEALGTVEDRDGRMEWFVYAAHAALIYPNRPVLVRDVPNGSVFNGGAHEVPAEQVTRFWTPDEDYPLLASSPMESILDDCERYVLLGRRTKKEAKSALGLNGIFYTAESAHAYPIGPDGKPSLTSQLDQDLAAVAAKAWDEEDSVAAVAPFSVHYGDGKDVVAPQWIDVGKALDPKLLEARREALECIVRGLPVPNVIGIEGSAATDVSHWGGWLVSQEFFTSGVAPAADPIFHNDLTNAMFRPMLRRLAAQGAWDGNPDEWRVGYDPTPVIIHPDKAGRAVELYKLGALSKLSALLESGFAEADMPSEDELAEFIRVQQAIHTRGAPPGGAPDAGTTVQAPPQHQAALAPYPNELEAWLADA